MTAPQPARSKVQLRGITWGHTRGYLPMVATGQRFAEMRPEIEIVWEKRSLQDFADFPIKILAEKFDLLVIDHPFVGHAAAQHVLLPLDEHLNRDFLADQEQNTVGLSFRSYTFEGHQWSLAIDAAAPVSSWRPDLLDRAKASVPKTWEELLDLARAGLVAFPAFPIDALSHFYMLCCALGSEPFSREALVVEADLGEKALRMLRELVQLCPDTVLMQNPIAIYEALTDGDAIAYCPFAFGYSNYARSGYCQHPLQFGDLCQLGGPEKMRSTLGGAGLAISATCSHREAALEYAQYVASSDCQRGLYVQSGGQPGHRSAWVDGRPNSLTSDYFRNTLPCLDRAYLRPRFDGYIAFQDNAARMVHAYLRNEQDARSTIRAIETLYEHALLQSRKVLHA